MTDKRIERNFSDRPAEEQQDFLHYTWCNECMKEDLGMTDPEEYQSKGVIYIEGKCSVCSAVVTTELSDDDD